MCSSVGGWERGEEVRAAQDAAVWASGGELEGVGPAGPCSGWAGLAPSSAREGPPPLSTRGLAHTVAPGHQAWPWTVRSGSR